MGHHIDNRLHRMPNDVSLTIVNFKVNFAKNIQKWSTHRQLLDSTEGTEVPWIYLWWHLETENSKPCSHGGVKFWVQVLFNWLDSVAAISMGTIHAWNQSWHLLNNNFLSEKHPDQKPYLCGNYCNITISHAKGHKKSFYVSDWNIYVTAATLWNRVLRRGVRQRLGGDLLDVTDLGQLVGCYLLYSSCGRAPLDVAERVVLALFCTLTPWGPVGTPVPYEIIIKAHHYSGSPVLQLTKDSWWVTSDAWWWSGQLAGERKHNEWVSDEPATRLVSERSV